MLGRIWQNLIYPFTRSSNLGTAANPEIIDPGAPAKRLSRRPLAWALIKTIFGVSLPAIVLIWCSVGLVQAGLSEGSLLAWIVLLMITPFTFVFSMLALATTGLLGMALMALLRGRPVVFEGGFARPARPSARDVGPHDVPGKIGRPLN